MRSKLPILLVVGCGTEPRIPVDPVQDPTSASPVAPEELCNDLDDDGDGLVDEDVPCPDPTCFLLLPDGGPVDVDPICTWELPSPTVHGPELPLSIGQLTDDNGDGRIGPGDIPELVVANTGSQPFRVLQGDGTERFVLPGLKPGHTLIVDADGDGVDEIYAVNAPNVWDDSREIEAWTADGTLRWTSDRLRDGGCCFSEYAGLPTAGDLDGDGIAELVFGVWILSADDGHLVRQLPFVDSPVSTPTLADLDGDGKLEILLDGSVFGPADTPLWSADVRRWDPRDPGAYMGSVFQAAVEMDDGDPELEVVVVADSEVYGYSHDGIQLWHTVPPVGYDVFANPCIADFDGDSALEIGVALGRAVAVLELDGSLLWTAEVEAESSCSAADLDGDGAAELVVVGSTGLRILDGPSGATEYRDPEMYSFNMTVPAIVDFDGDGRAEIVAASTDDRIGGAFDGYKVYDSPRWPGVGSQWSMTDFSDRRLGPSGAVSPETAGLYGSRTISAPATPGPSPVMRVTLHDVCFTSCEPDGVVRVSVVVSNVGERDAVAGVPLQVVNRASDGVETVLVEVALPEIPSGRTLDALDLSVPPTPGEGQLFVRLLSPDQCLTSGVVDEPC